MINYSVCYELMGDGIKRTRGAHLKLTIYSRPYNFADVAEILTDVYPRMLKGFEEENSKYLFLDISINDETSVPVVFYNPLSLDEVILTVGMKYRVGEVEKVDTMLRKHGLNFSTTELKRQKEHLAELEIEEYFASRDIKRETESTQI